MRLRSMIRSDEGTGQVPGEQRERDINPLIDELARSGRLPVSDGPLTDTEEVIGGPAILDAESKDDAIEPTRRFLGVEGGDGTVDCELRQPGGPEFGGAA